MHYKIPLENQGQQDLVQGGKEWNIGQHGQEKRNLIWGCWPQTCTISGNIERIVLINNQLSISIIMIIIISAVPSASSSYCSSAPYQGQPEKDSNLWRLLRNILRLIPRPRAYQSTFLVFSHSILSGQRCSIHYFCNFYSLCSADYYFLFQQVSKWYILNLRFNEAVVPVHWKFNTNRKVYWKKGEKINKKQ